MWQRRPRQRLGQPPQRPNDKPKDITMSNATSTHNHSDHADTNLDRPRRLTTETKASTKTTEFFVYLAAVLAVAITAFMVNDDGGINGGTGVDPFSALDALRFITYLTIGYMIARGLAKAGSRDAYDDYDA
jgi:hypothetical protein